MPEANSKRLDSWKEIATHLGRDQRTAMRWAKLGMPVHHVPGGKRGRVFAYPQEVDAWLAGAKPSEPGSATFQADTAAPRPNWLARIPRFVQAGILAALAIGLYAAVALVWKAAMSSPLASVALRENKFVGLDKTGRVLWSYPLPPGDLDPPPSAAPGIAYVGDLLGDGHKEVLVSVRRRPGLEQIFERALYCFSETGNLMWRYEFHETLTFGSGDYGPPWNIGAWSLHRTPVQTRIALAVNHDTWWPSSLVLLEHRGQEVSRFVNSGQIYSMAWLDTPSGPLLLAGGVRNHEDEVSGALVVLDGNRPFGTSPEQPGSGFECKSCPSGRPLKYYVFPRSELNRLDASGHNRVQIIDRTGKDIRVETLENAVESARGPGAIGIFEFSEDFRLKRASWSDGYREAHRKLEREGKIAHPWEQCPDRLGPRLIHVWDPEHGWTEIHPNLAAK